MASATAGLVAGVLLAEPLADLLGLDDANLVRAGFVGVWAQMNYEQLTSLFRAEERSTEFVAREPRQHRRHDRRHDPARRRLGAGRARRHRRQLRRHARRLPGAARRAPGAARAPVLAAAAAGDEPLRDPARPRRAGADRRQLQRPLLPRPPREPGRGRALRDRRPDRVGDGAAADRVPDGVARVRVLDRGRRRGEAHVRVRAHLPRHRRVVARARARPAGAVARAAADARRSSTRASASSRRSRSAAWPTPPTS